MPRRIRSITTLLAVAAASSVASAQPAVKAQPALGLPTSAQQLLAGSTLAPAAVPTREEAGMDIDLVRESMPSDNFGPVSLHESSTDADDEGEATGESGFFGSTTGRVSIVALAAAAGTGYFVFNGNGGSASDAAFNPSANPLAPGSNVTGFADGPALVTPEPASTALLALGLGTLAVVARRRRSS